MEVAIRFENVTKFFDNAEKPAVKDITLDIHDGEFITILGSSGCGKTTLMKMVNRLYEPDSGRILFFGKDIASLNAVELRRQIGYVVQQAALFPHMTIAENIATVPKIIKWKKEKIATRVKELLELVQLEPDIYMKRYPKQLSGGQQQRVGLARALAAKPKMLLMDEPFGAIDAITRSHLQDELIKIHSKYNKTILFVTHDVNEALRLGNRVLVMSEGKIKQFATPSDILNNPADEFVKNLIQSSTTQTYELGGGI